MRGYNNHARSAGVIACGYSWVLRSERCLGISVSQIEVLCRKHKRIVLLHNTPDLGQYIRRGRPRLSQLPQ